MISVTLLASHGVQVVASYREALFLVSLSSELRRGIKGENWGKTLRCSFCDHHVLFGAVAVQRALILP